MRGYRSLRRRADFGRVSRRGRRRSASHLVCLVAPGYEITRVGITVSASIGNAVVRNRVRRRIRAILDGCMLGSQAPRDIVLIAREGIAGVPFSELRAQIERTLSATS